MIDIEKLKPKIVEALMPLKPDKIILFGSYAYGTPNEDSDIDLYIVTNDDFLPTSWKEKYDISKKYVQHLDKISNLFLVDIITHTSAMHKKFVDMDSMFSRKILGEGINLI